jgi:hypothetical protein
MSTTNITRTGLESNPGLRNEKPANSHVSPYSLIYRYSWTTRTAQTTLIASRECAVAHLLDPYNTGALFDPINIVSTSCLLPYSIKGGHWMSRPLSQLTPWSRILLEKLTGIQLVKKFPAIYGNRRFITPFTSARHLSLSWASSIQSILSHLTSWKSILILSSYLRLSLPSFLSLTFPHQNPVYTSPLPHTRYMPCPSHYSW